MLHRLPNGAWIEPSEVRRIIPHPADAKLSVPDLVTLLAGGTYIELRFDGFDRAQEYADSLAAVVNAARSRDEPRGAVN